MWKRTTFPKGEHSDYEQVDLLKLRSAGESVSVDDTSSAVQYAGFSAAQAQAVVPVDTSTDFQGTLSETQSAGATANITFQGADDQISSAFMATG